MRSDGVIINVRRKQEISTDPLDRIYMVGNSSQVLFRDGLSEIHQRFSFPCPFERYYIAWRTGDEIKFEKEWRTKNNTASLFENLKIADTDSYKEHLNRYNVIKINIQEFLSATSSIDELLMRLRRFLSMEL